MHSPVDKNSNKNQLKFQLILLQVYYTIGQKFTRSSRADKKIKSKNYKDCDFRQDGKVRTFKIKIRPKIITSQAGNTDRGNIFLQTNHKTNSKTLKNQVELQVATGNAKKQNKTASRRISRLCLQLLEIQPELARKWQEIKCKPNFRSNH